MSGFNPPTEEEKTKEIPTQEIGKLQMRVMILKVKNPGKSELRCPKMRIRQCPQMRGFPLNPLIFSSKWVKFMIILNLACP